MGKVWKVLRILAVVVTIGFFALFMAWYTFVTVGYLNLTASLVWIVGEASLAMEYPLEPGEEAVIEERDGKLVKQRFGGRGTMFIKRKPDGDRYVTFERGGGFLGPQGYVYAPYAEDSTEVHNDVFDGFEGSEVVYLYGSWWRYDSTED